MKSEITLDDGRVITIKETYKVNGLLVPTLEEAVDIYLKNLDSQN